MKYYILSVRRQTTYMHSLGLSQCPCSKLQPTEQRAEILT